MSEDGIYGWRNAVVVILCEHREGRWLLSRSWIDVDQLTHVRRWDFASAHLLIGQIRRLVRDATGSDREADRAIADAKVWAAQFGTTYPGTGE